MRDKDRLGLSGYFLNLQEDIPVGTAGRSVPYFRWNVFRVLSAYISVGDLELCLGVSFICKSQFLMIHRSYICKSWSSNDDSNERREQESLRDDHTDRRGSFQGPKNEIRHGFMLYFAET